MPFSELATHLEASGSPKGVAYVLSASMIRRDATSELPKLIELGKKVSNSKGWHNIGAMAQIDKKGSKKQQARSNAIRGRLTKVLSPYSIYVKNLISSRLAACEGSERSIQKAFMENMKALKRESLVTEAQRVPLALRLTVTRGRVEPAEIKGIISELQKQGASDPLSLIFTTKILQRELVQ